jgi:cell division septum initiation protein DivIVA
MIGRTGQNSANLKLGPLALEVAVVILGILIAFQIDRWAEERRDLKQEYEYLLRLKEDLQIEIRGMDQAIEHTESRIAAILFIEEAIEDPSVARDRPAYLPTALETSTWRSFPQVNAFVYTELQSTGNLALIRSDSLRRALAEYYSSIRHYSRVGLDLDIQHQFDRLTAGVLTTAELMEIEKGSWSDSPGGISAERAAQIATELAKRQSAIDLLPNIAQHHVFNQKVIELVRSKANSIINQIDSLLEEF